MKIIVILLFIIAFFSCKDIQSKKNDCFEFQNIVSTQKVDSTNFEEHIDSNYLNKFVKMEDVDTLYRYRNSDGWSRFDYICSVYKQRDTPQYKVQLLRRERDKKIYNITTKTIDTSKWLFLKNKFDEKRFWCYKHENAECIDCGFNLISSKVKGQKLIVSLHNLHPNQEVLKGLAMDILETADNHLFHSIAFCKTQKDSINLVMYAVPFEMASIAESIYFKSPFKNDFIKHDGVGEITIHKKDSNLVHNIELVMKFHNGTTIRTTQKEIRY